MRQITEQAVNAMKSKGKFKQGNTEVIYSKSQDSSYMALHGNTIAILKHFNNTLSISTCGYKTNTTKERLNGFDQININQSKGVWYLNGKEWNGELIDVKL